MPRLSAAALLFLSSVINAQSIQKMNAAIDKIESRMY